MCTWDNLVLWTYLETRNVFYNTFGKKASSFEEVLTQV